MKTLFWIMLVAGLCIALFGCGGSDPRDEPDESAQPVACQPAGCAQ